MNIVKFKDIRLEHGQSYSDEFVELFNEFFKGKYCYWPNCMIAVPFADLSIKEYIDLSRVLMVKGENIFDDWAVQHYIITNDTVQPLVDMEATMRANSIRQYKVFNDYLPDSDITVDELKKFRTWLASTLLKFDQEEGKQIYELFNEDQTHMLEYYANHRYDEVIKYLSRIDTIQALTAVKSTSCGCTNNTALPGTLSINTCDPIALYRKSLYNLMVESFSKIDFWTVFDPDFLIDVKHYIEGIIKCDFPLSAVEDQKKSIDCACLINNRVKQEELLNILRSVVKAFELIAKDDIQGNKNMISTALNQWSSMLYENMEW